MHNHMTCRAARREETSARHSATIAMLYVLAIIAVLTIGIIGFVAFGSNIVLWSSIAFCAYLSDPLRERLSN